VNEDILLTSGIAGAVLDVVHAAVVVMDREGRIVLFNKACQELTGYTVSEVENRYPWDLFILPEETEEVKTVFSKLAAGDFPNNHTNYWLTKSGDRRLVEWSNTALLDDHGAITYVIGTGIDITERSRAEKLIETHKIELENLVAERTYKLHKANKKLERMAHKDGLTGIYNRRYCNDTLEREIRRVVRDAKPLSVMLCDVDFFKTYNDTFGHVAGDECLKDIAGIIARTFHRASDMVARYGGEEFIVVLPDISAEEAALLAENLLEAVWDRNIPNSSSSIADRVTISIGVATIRSDRLFEVASLIRAADQALYEAKNAGRNLVRQRSLNQ
jgi:diguanylate cyclase (GGDEF)-like protein/PAS domain S-box-containing protein